MSQLHGICAQRSWVLAAAYLCGSESWKVVWARGQWDDASAVPQTYTHQYFQVGLTHLYPGWPERTIQQCCESNPQQLWWIDLFISKSQLLNVAVHTDPTTCIVCSLSTQLSPQLPIKYFLLWFSHLILILVFPNSRNNCSLFSLYFCFHQWKAPPFIFPSMRVCFVLHQSKWLNNL